MVPYSLPLRGFPSTPQRCFDSLTPAVSEELRIAFADWAIAMLGVDGLIANLDVYVQSRSALHAVFLSLTPPLVAPSFPWLLQNP